MPNFVLVTQHPKPVIIGPGTLSIGKDGFAEFFSGDASADSTILSSMVRVKIEWAAAAGILVSGMEPDGIDRSGRQKFKFQEWLLRYPNLEEKMDAFRVKK